MRPKLRQTIFRWLVAFGVLAAVVAVGYHWLALNSASMSALMLLLVLLIASKWTLRLAIAVALAASACFAYYFLPPVGFAIEGTQNWVAFGCFVVAAIIGSSMAQRARSEEEKAIRRQREINVLFTLSRELMGLHRGDQFHQNLVSNVQRITGAESVALYLLRGEQTFFAGPKPFRHWTPEDLNAASSLEMTMPYRPDAERVALRSSEGPCGLLVVRGARLSAESVHAIGGLIAFALDALNE